jgi:putative SOS response-associated peptidase YedK
MWADGGPIDPSPTVDQAINGGYPWLEIECSRCKTRRDVDLAALRHPPTTFVHDWPAGSAAASAPRPAAARPRRCCSWHDGHGIRIWRPDLVQSVFDHHNQAAISALFRVVNRYVGNLASMPGVFPDYKAPIVRTGAEGRELATARWGMPSSSKALLDATKKRAKKLQAKGKLVDFRELLRMEPDSGTTNIRKVESKHWTRWLGPQHRCVVPFNSFSEFNKAEGGDIWFAFDEGRPLACFAGIWTKWTSVRKVKEGETTNDLYAFLTTGQTPRYSPSTRRRCR